MNVSDLAGFDKIIGQELAKHVLMRAVRSEPTHAYLFLGLQGTGKMTTALEFAKALSCENPVEANACGECAVCHAIEHGNYPDIRIWSPDGQNTTIGQMRQMRELASFRPIRGKWLVNIIEQADTLNEESANCILKLLEEPPAYLINILLFRNAANILPTIKSRCQIIRFTQVRADELAQRLVEEFGIDRDEAEFLATYSQGRPGIAIGLIGNEDFRRKREMITSVVRSAASGDTWSALKLAETLRSSNGKASMEADAEDDDDDSIQETRTAQPKKNARDTVLQSLDMLLVWYRDLLVTKLRGDDAPIVNMDMRQEIIEQCARYRYAGRLLNAVEAILHAKRGIQGNANAQIVTEALIIRLSL